MRVRKRSHPNTDTSRAPLPRSYTTGHLSREPSTVLTTDPPKANANANASALLHRRSGSLHRVASLASLASAPGPHLKQSSRPQSSRPPSSAGGSARGSPAPLDTSRPGTREGSLGVGLSAAEAGAAGTGGGGNVSIEAQNKNALSRCVMAGLRLWGYSQAKVKRSGIAGGAGQEKGGHEPDKRDVGERVQEGQVKEKEVKEEEGKEREEGEAVRQRAEEGTTRLQAEEEATRLRAEMQEKEDEEVVRRHNEEYKALYHQTLKAAGFALRRCTAAQLVPQERMRDVVEKVLELFCGHENGEGDGEGGGRRCGLS